MPKDIFRKTSSFLEAMHTLSDTSDDDTQSDTKKAESPSLIPDPIPTNNTIQTDDNDL